MFKLWCEREARLPLFNSDEERHVRWPLKIQLEKQNQKKLKNLCSVIAQNKNP